ncbi:MAG TPA: hypothetical protein VM222_04880 [Planctomycetota bacterium]|nr:hypothetical protein [Planctomycetota bacterium]
MNPIPFAFLLLVSSTVAAQDLKPAPDAAAQKKAEKEIRELLKSDYAKKDRDGRRRLAEVLLNKASETEGDPVTRFVLLREARDMAIEGFSLALASKAIGRLAEYYDVKADEMRTAAVGNIRKAVKSRDDAALAVEAFLSVAEAAVEKDDVKGAIDLAKEAEAVAKTSKDAALVTRASDVLKDLTEIQRDKEQYTKAGITLAADPNNAEANLTVGKYLCFVKHDLKEGLICLEKTPEAALAEAVRKELAEPATPEAQAELAEAWWAIADKTKSPKEKRRYQERAYVLCELAYTGATGLGKNRMQLRLKEFAKQLAPKGSLDLLKIIDVKKAAQADPWSWQDGALVCPATAHPVLVVPYLLPEEYDLKIVAERKGAGGGALVPGIRVGDKRLAVAIDILDGFTSSVLTGVAAPNETVTKGKVYVDEKPKTVLISVRTAAVTVSVDGKPFMEWKVDPKRIEDAAVTHDKKALSLSGHMGLFHITQLQLTTVSGLGHPLR